MSNSAAQNAELDRKFRQVKRRRVRGRSTEEVREAFSKRTNAIEAQRLAQQERDKEGPKNRVPLRQRSIFGLVHWLGTLQSMLMRLTDEALYVSSDGRTMLVSQMDDRHLKNAVKKMHREGNCDFMYDALVREEVSRGMRSEPKDSRSPLEVGCAEVREAHNRWYRRAWRFATLQR